MRLAFKDNAVIMREVETNLFIKEFEPDINSQQQQFTDR